MSNDTDTTDAKLAALRDLMPGLLFEQGRLHAAGLRPSAVVLPADLDPGKYEGEGATDTEPTFMGLPIIWGDRVGLVVAA